MDKTIFEYLTNQVLKGVSTEQQEERLISMLKEHMEEKENERKQLIYSNACAEIDATIAHCCEMTGENAIDVILRDGNTYENHYRKIKSAYYDKTTKKMVLITF